MPLAQHSPVPVFPENGLHTQAAHILVYARIVIARAKRVRVMMRRFGEGDDKLE